MHTQEEAGRRTIRYNIMNTTKTEKNIPAIPFYKQILTEPAQAHIKPTEQQHRVSHKHYRMTTHYRTLCRTLQSSAEGKGEKGSRRKFVCMASVNYLTYFRGKSD